MHHQHVHANGDSERAADRAADRVGGGPASAPFGALSVLEASSRSEGLARLPAVFGESAGGEPLPAATKTQMQRRFGWDFGAIRVHSDESSAHLNEQLRSAAYTVGRHISFGRSRFQPDTTEGRQLLAHELSHVIQQHCGDVSYGALQLSGTGKLATLDSMLDAWNVDEAAVLALLRELDWSDIEEVLKTPSYKTRMVASLNPSEMASAMAGMGVDLAIQLDWMLGSGTSYDLVKAAILSASATEQNALLLDPKLLPRLREALWWHDFARMIELLGQVAPDRGSLLANPKVMAELDAAWQRSNPGVRVIPVTTYIHEEGGIIYFNLLTAELSFRLRSGGPFSTNLRMPGHVPDSVVVGTFHTHPQLGADFKREPSPEDITQGAEWGVPGIIRTEEGGKLHYYFYGPEQREHLAGSGWPSWSYPGSDGGVAP